MKIYTKTGDKGTTSLFSGKRVPKHHIRIESYGTVDELNSIIGVIRDQKNDAIIEEKLIRIQTDLFTLGAMLATPTKKEKLNISKINVNSIQFLEDEIDAMNSQLPPMTHFILPGGHQTVSFCHIARTVCRRAERLVVLLNDQTPVEPNILMYLNRLSDYLFVLARKLSKDLIVEEIKWIPEKF